MPDYRIYEIGQDGYIVRLLAELALNNGGREHYQPAACLPKSRLLRQSVAVLRMQSL
jgi:hypothetical protein